MHPVGMLVFFYFIFWSIANKRRRLDGGNTLILPVPSGVPKSANPNLFYVKGCFGFAIEIEDVR